MICRFCNYPITHVVETKNDDMRNQTIRRRECLKCGQRFTTEENLKNIDRRKKHDESKCGT